MINIDIDPVAFLNVRWYGIAVALAIVVIVGWLLWKVKKGAKISADTVLTVAIVGIPSGVIFARLLHVLDNIVIAKLHPELVASGAVYDYLQHPSQIIGGSGLTIYGAILGASLGIWIYSRFARLDSGYIFDLITPALALAQVIGRGGCTVNGCCYGSETSLPWGIVYLHPESLAHLGIAVHPTQVYEIIFLLIVFCFTLWLSGRLKPSGSLFLLYLALYSAWRIGIGFLRDGEPFLFGLHQAQVVGIVVLLITVPVLIIKTRWVKKEESISPD